MSEIAERLVCAVCKSALEIDAEQARCLGCERLYAVDAGVLDLTPVPPPDDAVLERWQLWEQLQHNGAVAYEEDPPSSLSVGEREDAAAFAAFGELHGDVLDIGCGPQELPSYAAGQPGFVGIDPLRGATRRGFDFVQGIAEYLPFADGSFDRVLFGTSLDHVLSPELSLREARRVLRPGGAVVIWLGEIPEPAEGGLVQAGLARLRAGDLRGLARGAAAVVRSRRQPPAAEPRFEVPEGAIDAFHFDHPNEATVRDWLSDAGLRVDRVERSQPGSCFIWAVPAADRAETAGR